MERLNQSLIITDISVATSPQIKAIFLYGIWVILGIISLDFMKLPVKKNIAAIKVESNLKGSLPCSCGMIFAKNGVHFTRIAVKRKPLVCHPPPRILRITKIYISVSRVCF